MSSGDLAVIPSPDQQTRRRNLTRRRDEVVQTKRCVRLPTSSDQGFEVRLHNSLDPTDSGEASDLVHREHPFLPSLAERLERHVESDLVPILEAVDNRLCDGVDTNRLAFDPVFLDSFGQRRT